MNTETFVKEKLNSQLSVTQSYFPDHVNLHLTAPTLTHSWHVILPLRKLVFIINQAYIYHTVSWSISILLVLLYNVLLSQLLKSYFCYYILWYFFLVVVYLLQLLMLSFYTISVQFSICSSNIFNHLSSYLYQWNLKKGIL